jgi:hypothetical protein
MGQAFDAQGDLLSETRGATKREVFDTLNARHPDAAAIHIRSLANDAEVSAALKESAPGPHEAPAPRDRLEQFFRFDHLPFRLQAVSQPFADLAAHLLRTLPSNPERTVCLRKLLESKDCAVRALIFEG